MICQLLEKSFCGNQLLKVVVTVVRSDTKDDDDDDDGLVINL